MLTLWFNFERNQNWKKKIKKIKTEVSFLKKVPRLNQRFSLIILIPNFFFFFFFFFFFLFFDLYILFSPSSDIQRVGEDHPSACLTNYSKGIFFD